MPSSNSTCVHDRKSTSTVWYQNKVGCMTTSATHKRPSRPRSFTFSRAWSPLGLLCHVTCSSTWGPTKSFQTSVSLWSRQVDDVRKQVHATSLWVFTEPWVGTSLQISSPQRRLSLHFKI